jgi:hypothetical protein
MFRILGLILAAALVLYAYTVAKTFVRTRLKFVDAAVGRAAPVLAGIGAFLLSLPLFWLVPLPFFGLGTSIAVGLSVGAGVSAGARDIRETAGYIRGP